MPKAVLTKAESLLCAEAQPVLAAFSATKVQHFYKKPQFDSQNLQFESQNLQKSPFPVPPEGRLSSKYTLAYIVVLTKKKAAPTTPMTPNRWTQGA